EVADLSLELQVAAAAAAAGPSPWDPDLGQQLVGTEGSGERPLEEVVGADRPLAGRGPDHELSFQRQHHRSPVAGRIPVAQRATDGSKVANQRVGDLARGVAQDRADSVEAGVALHVDVSRAGTDPERLRVSLNVRQPTDATDV